MRAVLQRVRHASVAVDDAAIASIGPGLLVLAGVLADDSRDDVEWLARKIVLMRVFADDTGTMNRSILDMGGELLVVSQFTLYASTRQGNRPSWSRAAPPAIAAPLFGSLVVALTAALGKPVATGRFGADMAIALVNDGPVTLVLDSRARE
ncbi:MAG TPA: D-aminoacyl-tRNA deacylase [Casimicrobiaceae bacterium]|jgi:D-tyrosyl-tRNA(Tyr) deacylase|nr:D-aminoacyl-tRNA deacylase [Casimicrobiaceae bacterium]